MHEPKGTKGAMSSNPNNHDGLMATLAHHDAAIVNLSSRVTSVEASIKSLADTVAHGFSTLTSQVDKIGFRPTFDFHKSVQIVMHIAILFSMVVGGIIWVTTGQFAAHFARQDSINTSVHDRLDKLEQRRPPS